MTRAFVALALATACARSRPAAPIVNYHAVGAGDGSEFTLSETDFTAQLDWLASAGFHTLSLHDLLARRGLERGVVLTFDDGTADALTAVLPALQKRGMRATFFIVTGFVGKPGYLDWNGVRALKAAGMEIGSHTVDHARLADLSPGKVRDELVESRRELEKQLDAPVDLLAYPFNSVRARVIEAAAAAGYRAAVSGEVHGGDQPLNLYRISVKRGTSLADYQRALTPERR